MSVVVTREEVIESIGDKIIKNINSNLLNHGRARYIIESDECYNREIAIKMGKDIIELYKRKGYDVDIYEYDISNRENYIGIYVSL